jgi:hypothetical protein
MEGQAPAASRRRKALAIVPVVPCVPTGCDSTNAAMQCVCVCMWSTLEPANRRPGQQKAAVVEAVAMRSSHHGCVIQSAKCRGMTGGGGKSERSDGPRTSWTGPHIQDRTTHQALAVRQVPWACSLLPGRALGRRCSRSRDLHQVACDSRQRHHARGHQLWRHEHGVVLPACAGELGVGVRETATCTHMGWGRPVGARPRRGRLC